MERISLSLFTYLIIYLFSFGTIFDWLTPLSAIFFSMWGDPILTITLCTYYFHLSFLGVMYICIFVYSFL